MAKKSKLLLYGLIKLAVILSPGMSESEFNIQWGIGYEYMRFIIVVELNFHRTFFLAPFAKFFIFFLPRSDSLKSAF